MNMIFWIDVMKIIVDDGAPIKWLMTYLGLL
jgi:hypothetical protein